VIVGGLGSMGGALAGGVLIGVSEALAAAVLPPSPQDMFRYMYAEMTPQLIEQEAALLAALKQQGEGHGTAHAR